MDGIEKNNSYREKIFNGKVEKNISWMNINNSEEIGKSC